MDTNTYFYLLAFGCMVLVGCVFVLYQKTKKIHDNQTQFQKHLMYQQSLIEKHNTILRNISLGQPIQEQTITPETIPSIENLQSTLPQQQPPVEKNENSEKDKASPISTLLPMISSLMGMMNNMGDGEDMESDLESEMDEEENDKKVEMVQEIEKELNELKNVEPTIGQEGRVEEEQKTEEVSLEE